MSVSPALRKKARAIAIADSTEPWVTFDLPFRVDSAANLRLHWGKMASSAAKQRKTTRLVFKIATLRKTMPLPCVIKMSRLAPRELDDDNLARALKSVRDGVADGIGLNDRDPLLDFLPDQEKASKRYSVRVEIYAHPDKP